MLSCERAHSTLIVPPPITTALTGAAWRRVISLVSTRVSRNTLTKLYAKFAAQDRPCSQETGSYRDRTHALPVGNLVWCFASQETEHDVG